MHYEILDDARRDLLPHLRRFKDRFYLAGGTGLALQIGHRDSVDFDFFTHEDIDTVKLFDEIRTAFQGKTIEKTQEEKNTLSLIIDRQIKLSFFTFRYPIVGTFIEDENIRIASIEDIACMKMSAIASRQAYKDYVDMYFILHLKSLSELFEVLRNKMPSLDENLVLKSLTYFEDISPEKIIYKNNSTVSFDDIKKFILKTVKDYVS